MPEGGVDSRNGFIVDVGGFDGFGYVLGAVLSGGGFLGSRVGVVAVELDFARVGSPHVCELGGGSAGP